MCIRDSPFSIAVAHRHGDTYRDPEPDRRLLILMLQPHLAFEWGHNHT